MIPEEAGQDPSEWPELRSAPGLKKDKVQWGEGVRTEEEAYLGKLGKQDGVTEVADGAELIPYREQVGDNQKQRTRRQSSAKGATERRCL